MSLPVVVLVAVLAWLLVGAVVAVRFGFAARRHEALRPAEERVRR